MLTESQEQMAVATYLRMKKVGGTKIRFTAVPHGGLRSPATAGRLKAEGVEAGCPDLLIFTRTEQMIVDGIVGIAIEMKRADGGQLSASQKDWLADLRGSGWACFVAKGSGEAIDFLRGWGF